MPQREEMVWLRKCARREQQQCSIDMMIEKKSEKTVPVGYNIGNGKGMKQLPIRLNNGWGTLRMKTKILYEDDQVMVCHKPAGLATQTAKAGQTDMVAELKGHLARQARNKAASGETGRRQAGRQRESGPYLGVIHRLDQPVEGLLVFAKTRVSAAKLTAQLTQGLLNKQYYAVICGQPEQERGELVDYLVKDGALGMAKVVHAGDEAEPEAKKAVLHYHLVRKISTPEALALMDIHIDTGRFHQIRVQMAHAGMPLLGDGKYGSECVRHKSNQLWIRNVALCAYKIGFTHPVTGKDMEFEIQPEGSAFGFFMGD